MATENYTIKEIQKENGERETVKAMSWPVKENPDKTWGSKGYERETR